jgi:hypothetical protein
MIDHGDTSLTLPLYLAPAGLLRELADLLRAWAFDLLHAARDLEAAVEASRGAP